MDNQKSSYDFHCGLEPPLAFLRSQWKAVLVFGGGFCLVMLGVVMFVDPAFFYPRIQTDPLNYLLKAKALAETGSTSARWAVNLPPFAYAAFPGVMRVPLIIAFTDFDSQLRAIQIVNIPIVASAALVSAYFLSWTLPPGRHWLAIGFAFAFTMLSPFWIMNVFLPLADAPYALFTLCALLVASSIICSRKPLSHQPVTLAVFAVLFTASFLLRFTAPVIAVFVVILARGRSMSSGTPPHVRRSLIAASVIGLMILVGLNANAIFGRYLREPIGFLIKGEKIGMTMNLLGAAIPSQVVPNFQLGFVHPPIADAYRTNFTESPLDTAWLAVGLAIAAVVITGLWQSRRRFLPEIGYFLAALPVLGLMMPSTTRYLMSYQPLIWIFFYTGAAYLLSRYSSRIPSALKSRAFVTALLVVAAGTVVGLRVWRLGGTASERYFAVTASSAPDYIHDVASTFRGLRNFLETLPPEKTLLLGPRGTDGRWKIIANRDYYRADSALHAVARTRDVYLVADCGTGEECQAFTIWEKRLEEKLQKFGRFEFDSVYEKEVRRAHVKVVRVRAVD